MKSRLSPFRLRILTALLLLGISGCGDTISPVQNSPFGAPVNTTVGGVVVDEQGSPVAGATITVPGATVATTTDINGFFLLRNASLPSGRCAVKCQRSGYLTAAQGIIPVTSGIAAVRITLSAETIAGSFDALTGGTFTVGTSAATIRIPPRVLLKPGGELYTGQVSLIARYLDPTVPTFGAKAPASDMAGVDTVGLGVELLCFGIIDLNLVSPSGEILHLANGKYATLTFPIPAGRTAVADTTEPLWFFDGTTGLWKEDGSAARNGTTYIVTVNRSGSWNVAYKGARNSLGGRVMDCHGWPVAGARVSLDGPEVTTVADGSFRGWIPSGIPVTIRAYCPDTLSSPELRISRQDSGKPSGVGDIPCGCPAYLTGTLKDCNGFSDGFIVLGWTDPATNTRLVVASVARAGVFMLAAPPNAQVQVTAWGLNGVRTSTIAATEMPDSVTDAGNFSICETGPGVTARNVITLNGGGFSNGTFPLRGNYSMVASPDTVWMVSGTYYTQQNDSLSVELRSRATQTGTYDWEAGSFLAVIRTTTPPFTGRLNAAAGGGQTMVTRYDRDTGGLVEGTYSGSVPGPSGTISVTGRFSILRR